MAACNNHLSRYLKMTSSAKRSPLAGLGLFTMLVALLSPPTVTVNAFSYYLSNPTQCGALNVTWSGGKGPWHLLIVPTGESSQGQILNVTIPASASSPYFIDLAEPAGLTFLAAMWDSHGGYQATGVTHELTVGSSSNSSCLRQPGTIFPDFFFSTSPESNPSQCSSMQVTWDTNYTAPAHLVGMIPGGNIWEIDTISSNGQSGTSWTVDLKAGTQMLLAMSDSPADGWGTGGSTPLWTVQGSSDSGCLTGSYPASITSPPSGSQTGGAGSGASSIAGVGGGGGGASTARSSNIGAIVGGVVGGIVVILLLLLLLWWFRRRNRRRDLAIANGSSGPKRLNPEEKDYSAPLPNRFGEVPPPRRSTFSSGLGLFGASTSRRDSDAHPLATEHDDDASDATYEPSPFTEGPALPALSTGRSSFEHQAGASSVVEGGKTASDVAPAGTQRWSGSSHSRAAYQTAPSLVSASEAGGGWSEFASQWLGNDARSREDSTSLRQGPTSTPQSQGVGLPIASRFSSPQLASHIQSPPGVATSNPTRSLSTRKAPLRVVNPTLEDQENHSQTARQPRFVLHEDSGMAIGDPNVNNDEDEVIDVPPRYDQLKR